MIERQYARIRHLERQRPVKPAENWLWWMRWAAWQAL